MHGTYTQIINASIEWTKTILFRPFNFKKWFFICIIAVLSAEFSGFNFNFNLPSGKFGSNEQQQSVTYNAENQGVFCEIPTSGATQKKAEKEWPVIFIVGLITAAVIVAISFVVFFTWVYSRFSFVFLNCIVKNDASIKIPFSDTRIPGQSYFKWNIFMTCAFLAGLLVLVLVLIAGIFTLAKISPILKILLILLWVLLVIGMVIVFAIVTVLTRDLILPVMYKNHRKIKDVWKEMLPLIRNESGEIFKYMMLKLGLRIAAAIVGGLAALAVIIGLMIPAGIIAGGMYFLFNMTPEYLKWGYIGLAIILGLMVVVFVIFVLNMVLLPISVFFKTFSLKFLARLDSKYDAFSIKEVLS